MDEVADMEWRSIGLEIRLINIFEDQQDLLSAGIGPVCRGK